MESSKHNSITLLPRRAPTNRTNAESSQRQYEAEQRRLTMLQSRRQEREFETRVVRTGPRDERAALMTTRLSSEPPLSLHPRDSGLASTRFRDSMEQRQSVPVIRGAPAAAVAEGTRERNLRAMQENRAAVESKRAAAAAEKARQQPMTFFDRFGGGM